MSSDLTSVLSQAYDEVPYTSHPFPQSTPEHLEAVARLFDLPSCPPARARVLELGCASGGNILPFAARFPEAQVVGIDLSAVQVGQGQQAIARAGLTNIVLKNMDLEQVDTTLGQFDYILCHGVYSWVPPSVQSAILRIASDNLAPDGVAFISYNTYPGWKAREIVRDAMLLRGARGQTPAEQLAYARGMVTFLNDMAAEGSVLKKTLEETLPTILSSQDYYLLHEFLEACNAPCYLKDFVAAAGTHGLAYLGDADPATMFVSNYGDKVATPLLQECGASQVLMEQYLDFITNRQFRQTLLVKQARASAIRYQLDNPRLGGFDYAAEFTSDQPLTLEGGPIRCTAWNNIPITLGTPAHKAVAQVLTAHYPATLGFQALVDAVGQTLGHTGAAVEEAVLALLNELVVRGGIRYRVTPVHVPATVGTHPRTSALLHQVPARGARVDASAMVCNAWHEHRTLGPLHQAILPLLDGQNDSAALVAYLVEAAQADSLQFLHQGEKITDAQGMQRSAQEQIPQALEDLRRNALLRP